MTEASHAVSLLYQALKAMVADEKTVAWLEANNPRALNQARQALSAYVGFQEEKIAGRRTALDRKPE
jgi:hypothetical protein